MKITMASMLTGIEHTREIDITREQLDEINSPGGRIIQAVVPHLNADDREFLMTGITPEEWEEAFGADEE